METIQLLAMCFGAVAAAVLAVDLVRKLVKRYRGDEDCDCPLCQPKGSHERQTLLFKCAGCGEWHLHQRIKVDRGAALLGCSKTAEGEDDEEEYTADKTSKPHGGMIMSDGVFSLYSMIADGDKWTADTINGMLQAGRTHEKNSQSLIWFAKRYGTPEAREALEELEKESEGKEIEFDDLASVVRLAKIKQKARERRFGISSHDSKGGGVEH